jgi:predicted DNA-binding transcriptional regulator YafY
MNRTDRLYALVEELRATAPRYRTAKALAERFEVSVRTVERDISALQQAGVPIYAVAGRRGGYTLDRTTTLPPLNFTPLEATAVAVALSRTGATPFPDAARTARRKVLGALPADRVESVQELSGRVRLLEPVGADSGSAPVPEATGNGQGRPVATPGTPSTVVEEAVASRRVLQIEYRDKAGEVSRRAIEPVAFVANGPHWYLVAWCRLRQGSRAFRTDRILRALATGETARPHDLEQMVPQLPDLVARTPSLD